MAYNLLDLRSRVRTKIKDSSYSAATIDGFINDALAEIAGLYPWKYFNARKTTDTLTIGSDTLPCPDDLDSTSQLILTDPLDTTRYWNITKYRKSREDFFDQYPNAATLNNSQPIYWTEYGTSIYFNCPSDKAYMVTQLYQKIPTELSGDTDVPELPRQFREVIVLGATYRCEQERENDDIAALRQNEFGDKLSDLIMRQANDTLSGPDSVVLPAGSRDDW